MKGKGKDGERLSTESNWVFVGGWVECALCREKAEPQLKSSSPGNSQKPLENDSEGPTRAHMALEGRARSWATVTCSDTASHRLLAG